MSERALYLIMGASIMLAYCMTQVHVIRKAITLYAHAIL